MRYFVAILLLAFWHTSICQSKLPAGVANSYTLTAADGFPGSNYTGSYKQSNTGKIYTSDFFGTLHVTGNNYYKIFDSINKFENGACKFAILPNNTVVIDDAKNTWIVKNDTIAKTLISRGTTFFCSNQTNRVFTFRFFKNSVDIFELINEEWVLRNKFKWTDSVNLDNHLKSFIQTKKIWLQLISSINQSHFYEFDETNYQFHYKRSINKIDFRLVRSETWLACLTENLAENTREEQLITSFIQSRLGSRKIVNSDIFSHKFYDIWWAVTNDSAIYFNFKNGAFEYFQIDSLGTKNNYFFETNDWMNGLFKNTYYPYLTALTGNNALRIFPYIKKYPRLFNNETQSNNIFMISQDNLGRIWAGSYQARLSILSPNKETNQNSRNIFFDKCPTYKVAELKNQPYMFMNAGVCFNNNMYFVGETENGGILEYNMKGAMRKVKPKLLTGYYLYIAPKNGKLFYPSVDMFGDNPVYYCKLNDLKEPLVNWEKIGITQGLQFGARTLTEDSLGRIWIGHPQKGFAVYNPSTDKAISYDYRKKETPIGFISCLTDKNGTVWMGSDNNGLWYYNNYNQEPTPKNIQRLAHPLLNNCKRITAMAVYKDWLILGCYNKICLVNLDSFYKGKKIVRYLNKQETAFTSFTEQNTMLVSNFDSTVWFSTSDMLYQWDIKNWLTLPNYKVNVSCFIQKNKESIVLSQEKNIRLSAGTNSFDIFVEYLSPDCLPRYTRSALVKEGDSTLYDEPAIQNKFTFKNLSSGNYTFYFEVFEQDGNTAQYLYKFSVTKFLWQHWWFWVCITILVLIPIMLWLNTLRKEAIQQKEISHLNIVTLSNQFRPHFILNVLNTIGADLKDKPDAENVISRLGESINLIFNQSRKRQTTHTLKNEWILVENVIQIHKTMYIPDLKADYPNDTFLSANQDFQLPVGILEIFVENALLHGLRNRKNPPYILSIEITDDEENLFFTITDNGVGRSNAKELSNYKSHGTGTKNIEKIIATLNKFNKGNIEIKYFDNIYDSKENAGTSVIITVPKNFHYEY